MVKNVDQLAVDIVNKANELETLKQKLNDITPNVSNQNTNTNNKTVNNNNLTVNVLTKDYIIQNFTEKPYLTALENYGMIKIGNNIPDTLTDEDVLFVNTIINQEKNGKLVPYFGDILISLYQNPEHLEKQAMWCSDVSRLKFLVKVLPHDPDCNPWVSDPTGIIVKKNVIVPLLSYVIKCINDYMLKYKDTIGDNIEKYIKLNEIATLLTNDIIITNIAKYIAPNFIFGSQCDKQIKKSKKKNEIQKKIEIQTL
jgi:hypothetical protein